MLTKLNRSLLSSKRIGFCFVFCLALFSTQVRAQARKYNTSNAHAHNDYVHPLPFYTAYNAGFGSIEVDVFPVNGVLCVAHFKRDIQTGRTLQNLYLEPLLKELAAKSPHRLQLLVDIKENYELSLVLLIKEIEPLRQYLTDLHERRFLTIIISGSRPPPVEYKNYPEYIFFDDDLKRSHSADEWRRVGLVSLPFYRISEWKGEGAIIHADRKRIRHKVDSVHSAGKPIRFWAAPDTKDSWKLQMKLRANLVGTDKINELANFLKSRGKK